MKSSVDNDNRRGWKYNEKCILYTWQLKLLKYNESNYEKHHMLLVKSSDAPWYITSEVSLKSCICSYKLKYARGCMVDRQQILTSK